VARFGVGGLDAFVFAAVDDAGRGSLGDRLAGSARLADLGADAARGELGCVPFGGVAAVGPELVGDDACVRELVQQRDQVALFVVVAGAEQDVERQPARVDG
jgi:hypothetical protein